MSGDSDWLGVQLLCFTIHRAMLSYPIHHYLNKNLFTLFTSRETSSTDKAPLCVYSHYNKCRSPTLHYISVGYIEGPFKCYVTLFFCNYFWTMFCCAMAGVFQTTLSFLNKTIIKGCGKKSIELGEKVMI